MRRRLFISLAVVALVMCAAIAAMCAVTGTRRCAYVDRDLSYYRGPNQQVLQGLDQAYWQGTVLYLHSRRVEWSATGPRALAEFSADHPPRPTWHAGWHGPNPDIARLSRTSFWHALGFHNYRYDIGFSYTAEHHRVLVIPAWLPLLILLPPSIVVLRKYWWLPRRRRPGFCPTCGYDLRGTPDRCPECGSAVIAAAVAPARARSAT